MGGRVWDIDGNEYIDYRLAYGPIILGYADERVDEAAKKGMEVGGVFALSTELEYQVAQRISRMVPAAELVRFSNSGTEAVMAALRVARAYTGKDAHIALEGGYHGNTGELGTDYAGVRGFAGETNWSTINVDGIVVGAADQDYLNSGDPEGTSWTVPLTPNSAVYVAGHTAHRTINVGDDPLTYLGIYSCKAGHDYGAIAERNFHQIVVEVGGSPTMIPRDDYQL